MTKLYTLLVYSENIAGILNQITAVFTRRQVNIESLNVSPSSITGVHKYTITAMSDEEQIQKITKQIQKKIDVIHADFYTDEELFTREVGLYKLSTPEVLAVPEISKLVREADARIIEVNPTYCCVMINGSTDEIKNLRHALEQYNCVLQYTRSGRIALTRRMEEEVSHFLELRDHKE